MFLFRGGQGRDVVKDFTQAEDKLVTADVAASMAELTIRQQGHDTWIGASSVLLTGVDAATLTDSDFVFNRRDVLQGAIDAFFADWNYAA